MQDEKTEIKGGVLMEWISVKDRLPENDEYVLVYPYDSDHDIGAYYWPYPDNKAGDKQGKWMNESQDGYKYPRFGITHWMSLPEPPK